MVGMGPAATLPRVLVWFKTLLAFPTLPVVTAKRLGGIPA
jgi:hypothetical protein